MRLAVFLLAASALAQSRAVVLAPVLNMYSKPTAEVDVVSQAIYATTVGILEERQGFAKIKTPDEYEGWASLTSLRKLKPADPVYASAGRAATVESLFAHLYRGKSVTDRQPLLTVPFDTRLEVVGDASDKDERWLQVRLPDDQPAWIQNGDITLEPKPLTIPELAQLSKRFLGLPYTWGGTSSYGYDCSGFTQMLCRRGGRQIPRDADQQADWDGMTKIEARDLQPGDLLYFGSSPKKITHTGFYLGNGEFIHATTYSKPVIQVSKLTDERWTRLLVATRRWTK